MLTTKSGTRSQIKNLGLAALAATMTWGTMFAAQAQSQNRTVAIDAGSVIPVKLDQELSSNAARKGDTFTVTLRNDADAEYYRLPTGSHIEGVVRDARPKHDKDPGVLDLEFRRLRLPDGHSYAIQGSLIGLDNKSVEKRSDGRLIAKPGHQNDRLTYVGYGAGAGLIAGLLTKHSLEDTAIGGGLGYLFGSLQKGQNQTRDVDLKPGTELGVRLDSGVSVANYGSAEDYNNYHARNDDAGRFHRDTNGNAGNNATDNGRDNSRDNNTANRDGSRDNGGRDNNANRNNSGYRTDDLGGRSDRNSRDDVNNTGRSDRNGSGQDRSADRAGNRDSDATIGVLVGDRNVTFDSTARPFMSNGVLMVPVRNVLRTARIPFNYDAQSKEIHVTGDGGSVRITLGSAIAVVNGERRVRLDASARQVNGTTYVPVKFFSLVTGREAAYDTGSRTLQVNLKSDDRDQTNRDQGNRDQNPNRDRNN